MYPLVPEPRAVESPIPLYDILWEVRLVEVNDEGERFMFRGFTHETSVPCITALIKGRGRTTDKREQDKGILFPITPPSIHSRHIQRRSLHPPSASDNEE